MIDRYTTSVEMEIHFDGILDDSLLGALRYELKPPGRVLVTIDAVSYTHLSWTARWVLYAPDSITASILSGEKWKGESGCEKGLHVV